MTDAESAIRRQFAEQAQQTFAPALNAIVWTLLRKTDRDAAEDEKMLYAAFASAYHYIETGTPADHQRAEWLISRVYATLGNGPEGVRHAERCLQLSEQHADELADYDQAFAVEAMARAKAVNGEDTEAQTLRERAQELGERIGDAEARKVFFEELEDGEWHGLQ